MLKQSDIDAIKSISIVGFLEQQGITPVKLSGGKHFFAAPYREEKEPSFIVDSKNRWHDFGTGGGGDVIDLVMKMYNADFRCAVKMLQGQAGVAGSIARSATAPATAGDVAPKIIVTQTLPLNHKALLDYLQARNVDTHLARKVCQQVNFTINGKSNFAIGFKNNKGGWELRNKYFKGSTSKDITIINPNVSKAGNGSQCLVFEGFMDYLSYLTMNRHNVPRGWAESPNDSIVVLNSVTNLAKAKSHIEQQFAVATFLDNDDVGQRASKEIFQMVKSGHPVWNASQCYQKYKDLNEYLVSLPRVQNTQRTGLRI
jgi:DNA primase